MVRPFCCGALVALGQTAPVLTIEPVPGTNQFQVSITNAQSGVTYELWSTPALSGPDYFWTLAAPGEPGQSNFIVSAGGYWAQFYQAQERLLYFDPIPALSVAGLRVVARRNL